MLNIDTQNESTMERKAQQQEGISRKYVSTCAASVCGQMIVERDVHPNINQDRNITVHLENQKPVDVHPTAMCRSQFY